MLQFDTVINEGFLLRLPIWYFAHAHQRCGTMNLQYWRESLTHRSYRDYLARICIITICIVAIIFGLVGWSFDLGWVWEIFGVVVMIVGAAILLSATLWG